MYNVDPKNSKIVLEDYTVGYRSNSKSAVWNKTVQGVVDATMTISAWQRYLVNKEQARAISNVYEAQCIASQIISQRAMLEGLSGYLLDLGYYEYPYFYCNFEVNDNILSLDNIEVSCGTLHLSPISSESKINVYDNFFGDPVMDEVVDVGVSFDNGETWDYQTPSLRYICNGDMSLCWEYLSHERPLAMVQIDAPNLESPFINTISVNCHPDFAQDLYDIQHRNSMGEYESIPGFYSIKSVATTREYYMDDMLYNDSIRILLQGRAFVLPNGQSAGIASYIVGLKNVWIGRKEFSQEGTAWLEFESKYFVRFIKALYVKATKNDPELIRIRLYTDPEESAFYDNANGHDPYPLTDEDSNIEVPGFTKKIYMKIELFYKGVTPTIHDVFISYIPGEI